MFKRAFVITMLLMGTRVHASPNCTTAPSTPASEPCADYEQNIVVNNVLYVDGAIGNMIYDLLAQIPTVQRIELNSYGGKMSDLQAVLVASRIRQMGITTSLREGAVCASACTLIYQAGAHREAHSTAWLGYHGAVNGHFYDEYSELCSNPHSKGCKALETDWISSCKANTDLLFKYLNSYGATPELKQDFVGREKDPHWQANNNCAQVMPWKLDAADAVQFNVVETIVDRQLNADRQQNAMLAN